MPTEIKNENKKMDVIMQLNSLSLISRDDEWNESNKPCTDVLFKKNKKM